MRLRLAAAVLGCLCLIAAPAIAGKTPSLTIVQNAEEPKVCDAFTFDYDLNFSVTFVVTGEVTDWYAITEHNIEAFITLWNNTHPGKPIPPDVEFDAVIGFIDPDGSITGEAGEYALLYKDGCFVVFIKAPLPPANVSPPKASKVEWRSLKQWQTLGYIGLR
jgi:hypothetical protein